MIDPETKERMRRRFYAHSKDYRPMPWCGICGSVNISESVAEGESSTYRIIKCNECGQKGLMADGFHICSVPGTGRAVDKENVHDFRDWLRQL